MLHQLSSSHDKVHGNISFMFETCSDSCHGLITTDRAWLFITKICNMLCQLSSSHDNGQSMVIRPQYETCFASCHRLMTTVRGWQCIPQS